MSDKPPTIAAYHVALDTLNALKPIRIDQKWVVASEVIGALQAAGYITNPPMPIQSVAKFLDEEWKHDGWERRQDAPFCACGQKLRDDADPVRALDEHRVQVSLAAVQCVTGGG